ncbi:MAG: hypothetical protein GXP62_04195 [Oligoflexia bacterium]|nr:hypothetical protein [Oligoflexia bacterium]
MLLYALITSSAFAMSNFPADLQTDLGMQCTATCDLCHSSPSGSGVPTEPFGIAMVDRGLTVDAATVAGALDAMVADAVDSDGDGIIDTEALAQGLNPNPTGADYCPVGSSITGPVYGCASVSASPVSGLAGLLIGLVALADRRRRAAA